MLVPALLLVVLPQDPATQREPQHEPQRAPHWAYVPPQRPRPPRDDVAPIDAFLLAAAARQGLAPAPEADRATLLRRVTLDLTGLPPTPAELDAFLADPSPDAWERVVDRLLASPHHGERMAQPWLDLARYADSDGFNFDRPRSMWPWRDWVVDALNRDVPFDRFTVLQLAGDLLPDAGDEGRIATGFHRNTPFNDEGGVDPAEARWERLLDRASTTATVWLGTTLHCAQCHDHKYDPISQREFYAMVAFFETQDEGVLELPTAEQRLRRDALRQEIGRLRAAGASKQAIQRLEAEQKALGIPSTLVLRERDGARAVTRLRVRGGYDAPGEEVAAGTPAALGAWPDGAPRDRLGLARWLVQPGHPLTARVHVNRLWGLLFGRPLVATPEDLGTQAPPPDHPDLLDWLATEFVRLGWSQQGLIRTIVLSRAYRRSTVVDPAQRALDPENRWFARQVRFRLDAEPIRDVMLAASGLLAPRLGGPPVFPLQADTSGAVALNKVDLRWRPSAGEDRHRRALYTFWRRTAPFVQFALFDAPTREQCTVRRPRTNTPLQALSALNDPAAWEAAQALGERMRTRGGTDRERLAFGFRLCTARVPDAAELDLLERALAAELRAAGDGALAWTLLGNALLNLDETLVRG